MSSQSIHITIPKPCHERWESMDTTKQGAFCHSCQKQVIDFSAMTDREVIEYLSKHQTGCGRFRKDQVDIKLTTPEINNGMFKWRALFLGLLSFASFKEMFAAFNSAAFRIEPIDTAMKISIDTIKAKEITVSPQPTITGDISLNSYRPIYQIPTSTIDTIPVVILETNDSIEKYLTAVVGGMTVGYELTPLQKMKYWFRRTFRIKKHS